MPGIRAASTPKALLSFVTLLLFFSALRPHFSEKTWVKWRFCIWRITKELILANVALLRIDHLLRHFNAGPCRCPVRHPAWHRSLDSPTTNHSKSHTQPIATSISVLFYDCGTPHTYLHTSIYLNPVKLCFISEQKTKVGHVMATTPGTKKYANLQTCTGWRCKFRALLH